jgi:hypothetical protein
VAAPQCLDLAHDGKQTGDEILELDRKLDDQIGISLAGDLLRRDAGGHQPIVQLGVALFEEIDKAAVEPHQAFAAIEVFEPQIKAKGKIFAHQQKGILRFGLAPIGRRSPDPQSGICCTRAARLGP